MRFYYFGSRLAKFIYLYHIYSCFRTDFVLESMYCLSHSVLYRRRCEDVVSDIHYKPAHQPIKALFCGGDQERGNLRFSTEMPVVCSFSWFHLFLHCYLHARLIMRAAKSNLNLSLNKTFLCMRPGICSKVKLPNARVYLSSFKKQECICHATHKRATQNN